MTVWGYPGDRPPDDPDEHGGSTRVVSLVFCRRDSTRPRGGPRSLGQARVAHRTPWDASQASLCAIGRAVRGRLASKYR
jgi:hypothetical protein